MLTANFRQESLKELWISFEKDLVSYNFQKEKIGNYISYKFIKDITNISFNLEIIPILFDFQFIDILFEIKIILKYKNTLLLCDSNKYYIESSHLQNIIQNNFPFVITSSP